MYIAKYGHGVTKINMLFLLVALHTILCTSFVLKSNNGLILQIYTQLPLLELKKTIKVWLRV